MKTTVQTQCTTYTFDSNLSCHIIKKNPIVYFVFNDARNNTKRYADCVCMLCFGAFDIGNAEKYLLVSVLAAHVFVLTSTIYAS